MASVIGLELRALWLQGVGENHDGNLPHIGLDCWSPNINIARDPRWGRTCETTGEDTFLTGVFGTEYTRGLQENTELDSDYLQAVVTLKHYAAYSLDNYADPAKPDEPSIQRHNYNAVVDPYDAATTFFPAWEMTVKESNPKGVMCSYNEYNGAPSCANKWLMKDVLRDKFGFDGYITGDSGAVEDIYVEDAHNYTDTPEEGIAAALEATTDIASSLDKGDHETGSPFTWYLQDAHDKKLVNDELIDSAMNHSLFLRFELGLFDSSSYENEEGFWHVPKEVINQEAHQKLAREVVEQSFVLLRNDNSLLPLDRETGANVAVIGPHYNASSDLQGNYLGQACAGADRFDYSCIRGVGQAITDANKTGKTTLTKGCDINSNVTSGIADAVDAAKAADYVVLVVGLNTDEIEAESHDRQYISLPGVQDQLIEEVVGAGKPTIVVLIHGGSIGIEYLHSWTGEEDMSILSTFYPGANGADVIASALFGDFSPTGLLPYTIYGSDYVLENDFLVMDMNDGAGSTYKYYGGDEELYGFGFGLSYFGADVDVDLEDLEIDLADDFGGVEISVGVSADDVRWAGSDVTALLFLVPVDVDVGGAQIVNKQLVGFDKGAENLTIEAGLRSFGLADEEGDVWAWPGMYRLELVVLGEVVATGEVELVGEKVLLNEFVREKSE